MREIQYSAPETVQDAVALLAQFGARARVMAGGTDLIPQLREHARDLDLVVDGKRIPELSTIAFDPSSGLTLGAAVPCYHVYADPNVISRYPALIDSASIIGGTAIQGRASIGGNLCNSGPAGDSIPTLIAYGAVALIAGPSGEREVPVEQFCTAPGRNVLQPGELLVAVRLPVPAPNSGAKYLRFIPRNEMDIAVVGVGVSVTLDASRAAFVGGRVALGAVAPTPLFVPAAGDSLAGKAVGAEAIAEAATVAQAAASPISDMRGTAEHRKHLVGVLVRRALQAAVDRALS